ncbi:hypothetical protein HPG69_002787, partial [Diceros bicornis minor]
HISYVPQLSNATLAGTVTQSTFTLEQPRGQFSHLNISDFDAIWLVVAHSDATQNFTAPQRVKDSPVPADFPQEGYYLTLTAKRALYPGGQLGNQLRVLRVGNNTHCSPRTRGCNHPLPGPGPYQVKFLVMSDRGPVADTEWSSETHLQQGCPRAPEHGHCGHHYHPVSPAGHPPHRPPGPAHLHLVRGQGRDHPGPWERYNTCGSMPISGPGESVGVRRYNTHHMFSPPAVGGS